MGPSIQGNNGGAALMNAARAVCWGFDLGEDAGCSILIEHFNPRCEPAWSESEIRKKCRDAMSGAKNPRGYLRDAQGPGYANGAATASATAFTTTGAKFHYADLIIPGLLGLTELTERTELTGLEEPAPLATRTITVTAEVNPTANPQPPTALQPAPKLANIRNFAILKKEGDKPDVHVGITPQQITKEIFRATRGWPKACGKRLFVPGPKNTPHWLDGPTDLFSWLASFIGEGGGLIDWGRGNGMIPKPEFFKHMLSAVEQYDDVQPFPHYPPRPGTYYMHPELPTGCSGAFDELLGQLKPATDTDRCLIRAFFLTLAWGGKMGGRPIFIFESVGNNGRPGQGAGKSTAAMLGGKLFGGHIGISLATADDLQVQTRILSEEGRKSRLVVFDNLKGTRTSNSLIESYVTSEKISGRELYTGEGTRPNIITWTITANQPSLSKDFVGRAYPIRIIPPVYSPIWNRRIDRLIEEHRWDIYGDIVAELKTDVGYMLEDGEWSRWPEWEAEVLCHVCDPRPLFKVVGDRRKDLDDDDATVQMVHAALRTYINKKTLLDPMKLYMIIPPCVLNEVFGKMCPNGPNPITVARWLSSMVIPNFSKKRTNTDRLWIWKGDNPDSDELLDWENLPLPM